MANSSLELVIGGQNGHFSMKPPCPFLLTWPLLPQYNRRAHPLLLSPAGAVFLHQWMLYSDCSQFCWYLRSVHCTDAYYDVNKDSLLKCSSSELFASFGFIYPLDSFNLLRDASIPLIQPQELSWRALLRSSSRPPEFEGFRAVEQL